MIDKDFSFEPVAEIHLNALKRNLTFVKDNLCGEKLFCVVKADGYGHGIEIAKYMDKYADGFAVSKVDEGIKLRFLGISKPILLLTVQGYKEIKLAINYNLILPCESVEYLTFLLENFNSEIYLNLKVDTGMNRLGFCDLDKFESALKIIAKSKNIRLCGVYSHFFNASSLKTTRSQYVLFDKFLKLYDKYFDGDRHISASGGFLQKKYNLDAVRIGLLLYGYVPSGFRAEVFPVMKILTNEVKRKSFLAGDKCLYNFDIESGEYSLINYGYADGLGRNSSPKRCMDICYEKSNGGKVVIMQDANILANKYDTIPYEILVGSARRIKKVYIGDV